MLLSKIRNRRLMISTRNVSAHFLESQAVGGLILLVCTILALLFANVPSLQFLDDIWQKTATIAIGDFEISMTLLNWLNDALMAVFFFSVGMEIKREMTSGELCTPKKAALPAFAALGGMIVPALLFTVFNGGEPTAHGWGIPMATDIAFALGILSLLGNRVPLSLKVFLTALAVVDDLGSIVVLAIFYPSHALHLEMLVVAGVIFILLMLMNYLRVNKMIFYIIPGFFLWYFVYASGVHATIAGVLLALSIPTTTRINELRFKIRMRHLVKKFEAISAVEVDTEASAAQQNVINEIDATASAMSPLLYRLERYLHPVVTFFIMPLFALANAGVEITPDIFSLPMSPIVPGIAVGLVLGKPIGITLFSFLAVKLGMANLPKGVTWIQLGALAVMGGIGFTMSIFIDGLAFKDVHSAEIGKAAILFASFIAAVLGLFVVHLTTKNNNKSHESN